MQDLSSFDIDFSFMVFQGNPKNDCIYYWNDGSKEKHKMMRDVFLHLVKSYDDNLIAKAYEACNTYSFYLWNKEAKSIIHLTPKSTKDDPYPDSVANIIQGKAEPRHLVKETTTLENVLAGYGFNTPTDFTTGNFQTSIGPVKKDMTGDRFGMIRQLLSGRRK